MYYMIRIEKKVNIYVGNGWRMFHPGHTLGLGTDGISLYNINGADCDIPYRADVEDEAARTKLVMWTDTCVVTVLVVKKAPGNVLPDPVKK